jgi:hypothetical protein
MHRAGLGMTDPDMPLAATDIAPKRPAGEDS